MRGRPARRRRCRRRAVAAVVRRRLVAAAFPATPEPSPEPLSVLRTCSGRRTRAILRTEHLLRPHLVVTRAELDGDRGDTVTRGRDDLRAAVRDDRHLGARERFVPHLVDELAVCDRTGDLLEAPLRAEVERRGQGELAEVEVDDADGRRLPGVHRVPRGVLTGRLHLEDDRLRGSPLFASTASPDGSRRRTTVGASTVTRTSTHCWAPTRCGACWTSVMAVLVFFADDAT